MDKFFIREIMAVWAFNQQNEAVWKCSNVGRLKITQDGEIIRKKDAQGATIFKMDTAKSANISFEVSYWDFNILSMISGSDKRELDGHGNPYKIEPIIAPHTETFIITDDDIRRGYIKLEEYPRKNDFQYSEIALHKMIGMDNIATVYHQSLSSDDTHFYVQGKKLMLPTSLAVGDEIETVYEYESYYGSELINTANKVPEAWKVRILMLVSPICNTNIVNSIWITARNATPEMALSLDFNVEDNIPISLDLGYSLCDREKKLYEIVSTGNIIDGSDLYTYDNEVLYTDDNESVKTIR